MDCLTVGQMIDRIHLNEIAEGTIGNKKIHVMKTSKNIEAPEGLYYCDPDGICISRPFRIRSREMEATWKIYTKKISFTEAMKELKRNRAVEFKRLTDGPTYRFIKENEFILLELHQDGITFQDLIEGEWRVAPSI